MNKIENIKYTICNGLLVGDLPDIITFVKENGGSGSGLVDDVQINGSTIVADKVANITSDMVIMNPQVASCVIAMNGSKKQTTLEYGTFNVANRIAQWDSNKCLYTGTPINNDHCANKSYVDNEITTLGTSLKAYIDSLNGNNMEF